MKFKILYIILVLLLIAGCTGEIKTNPEEIINKSPQEIEMNYSENNEIKVVQEKVFPVNITNLRYSKRRNSVEFKIINKGNSPVILNTLTADGETLDLTLNSDILAKSMEVKAKSNEAMKAELDETCVKKENSPLSAPHITPKLVFNFEFENKTKVVTIEADLDCT